MRVYLMRHGEAESPERYERDEDRPLSAAGREKLGASAALWSEQLAKEEPAPALWLVSPLVRAVQTFEITVAGLGGLGATPLQISRLLVPEGRISSLVDLLEQQGEEAVALVGHQPLMGGLAAFLLGWSSVPAQLQPGAILAIDRDEAGARLAWHLAPPQGARPAQLLTPPESD